MSLQTELIEKIKRLPEDKQLLVKSLVDELARYSDQQGSAPHPRWYGSLEGSGIVITDEDIAQARREMWDGFPREIEP